ncbi:MAG: lipopolysaccharide biosynthesis protein [Promethearchaeota archaeon]
MDTERTEYSEEKIVSKKKRTSSFFKVILISWGFIKLRGVIFNKIFTNILSKDDFGLFNFLYQTAVFIGTISCLGVNDAVFRFTSIYSEENDRKRISNLMITSIFIVSGIFVVVFGIFLVLSKIGVQNFNDLAIVLIGSYSFFFLIQILVNGYIQAEQRSFGYILLSVIIVYSNLILSVIFTIFINSGANDLLLAYILSQGIFVTFYLLKFIVDNGIGQFDLDELKNVMKYSLPRLIIYPFLPMFNYLLYFLLNFFNGSDAVALFVITLSVAGLLNIIDNAFFMPFAGLQYNLFDAKEHKSLKSLVNKLVRIYIAFLIPIILLIWINSSLLIAIFANEEYITSETVFGTLILALGFLFKALLRFTCQGPYFYQKTAKISVLYLCAVVASSVLGLFLIPLLGIVGMAISLTLHDLFRWLFVFPYSQKLFPIEFSTLKIVSIIIPTSAFILCIMILSIFSLPTLLISVLCVLVYFGLLFGLKIVHVNEVKRLFKTILPR